jgi:putative transposase
MLCALFGYSKQAYYKYSSHALRLANRQHEVKEAVLQIRRQLPRIGVRKLHYLLKDKYANTRVDIGRDKLFSILRDEGLLISKRKKSTITTNSKHWMRKYPNLIKDIELTRPEQVWVADITYLDASDSNAYLHLITDAYSKKIMGYELCNNLEAQSTLKALEMALKSRKYQEETLTHHSDRGLQYCSKLYVDVLLNNGIQISMTENGDPYENAIAERVNGILKNEFGLSERFDNLNQAKIITKQSISAYNVLRPHLSCHMLTPAIMHQQNKIKLKTWNKKTSNIFMDV